MSMRVGIVCVGAVYLDTILSVPEFPAEDEKVRATEHWRRRGGNCANTLEVLSELVDHDYREHLRPAAVELFLLSVLPRKGSRDASRIKGSIMDVDTDTGCIFREDHMEAARSYIIQAAANNSRTIVSHNPLPEMTTDEFVDSAIAIDELTSGHWELLRANGRGPERGRLWFHFEGRIPLVTEASVGWLCENMPGTMISVECEKPNRTYMADVAKKADVVFFSRVWVQAKGYEDPRAFLEAQLPDMKPGAILVCTWGSEGATCVHSKTHQGKDNEWASVKAWRTSDGSFEVVDTIGAGDTFIAGFLFALNCRDNEWKLEQMLRFANELAGRKVMQEDFKSLAKLNSVWNY